MQTALMTLAYYLSSFKRISVMREGWQECREDCNRGPTECANNKPTSLSDGEH